MNPIRLMIVVTDLEVGGAPLHLLRLVPGLRRAGYAVKVVCLSGPGPVGPDLAEAGAEVAACGARAARDVSALWRLARLVRAYRPHVLHGLLFHANQAVRLVAPVAGVPVGRVLCEIHTVEIERPWHLWADNLTCRMCREELGISSAVVRHLHRAAHIPESQLRVLEGGIDTDRFGEAIPAPRADLGAREGVPLLVWVGRFDPVKGFEELIEAFAAVRAEQDAQLLLVGEGAYRPSIERLIDHHRVRADVLLAGSRRDVPEVLAAADLFVFPSRTEGLPTALLEAMAAGKPVVTTDVAGCRDVVVPNRTGLIVPPQSPGELARAIGALLIDKPLATGLAEAARAAVRKRFGKTAMVERYVEVYRAVVQRPRTA